jgi:predicted Zn-dependent protease
LAVEQVMRAAEGLDLVGIWASGRLETGFANSLGQRNWHASASFNLDWSCYHRGDKAVKASYAGSNWMPGELPGRMASVRDDLAAMARTPLTIPPGRYRVYLAPRALQDLLDMLAWGGFDLKSRRTGQSPLIRMVADGWALHPSVTLVEDQALGLAPGFTGEGFAKPAHVALIEEGRLADCLVDARSGKEYGVAVNAAGRAPESLEMGAGSLAEARVLEALDTGLFVSRLWYLNYSDRSHARLTGMIRFACFWVERGQVRAPVNVMRFDDSVFHLLGDRLEGLTTERELILDPQTYGGRSYRSWRLPGALIEGMTFTL